MNTHRPRFPCNTIPRCDPRRRFFNLYEVIRKRRLLHLDKFFGFVYSTLTETLMQLTLP